MTTGTKAGKRETQRLPTHHRIGLIGGSFNPPHAGHLFLSARAKKAAKLHHIWWLISPQNPLKSPKDTAPLASRLAACQTLTALSRYITPTTLETEWGTRFSIDTIRALQRRYPRTRFLFILGMDNLLTLHRWKGAWELVQRVDTLLIDRPGYLHRARRSRFGIRLRPYSYFSSSKKSKLKRPHIQYLLGKTNPSSSTYERKRTIQKTVPN